MSTIHEQSGAATKTSQARKADLKLEAIIIPVSDVDRAKSFYSGLGWRLDADFVVGDSFRVVQFTPPGSPASIHFGKGLTSAAPGAAQNLYLVVSDIEAARAELVERGAKVGDVFHRAGPGQPPVNGRDPARRSYVSFASFRDRCSRKSPRDWLDAWTRKKQRSLRRLNWPVRFVAPRLRMASTRSGSARPMRTGRIGTPNTWRPSSPVASCRNRPRHKPTSKEIIHVQMAVPFSQSIE